MAEEPGHYDHLAADHPLMAPIQAAMFKQLSNEHERVDLKLRELEEDLRKKRKLREDLGVDLYGVQQQLAKMQMNFERTHDNYNIIQRYRQDAEEQLAKLQEQFTNKKTEVEEQMRKVQRAQEELNQLNRTLGQVEQYNDQMKGEIQVARRTTYCAEEAVAVLEKDKKRQDLLIDQMNEEIKRMKDQEQLLIAQYQSQQEETRAAQETLREATIEMEKIEASKKELFDDWNEWVRQMQRRDELLQTLRETLRSQRDNYVQVQSELAGVKTSIKKEAEKSEALTFTLQKLQQEQDRVAQKIEDLKYDREKLSEQAKMLKKSLDSTQDERGKLDTNHRALEEQYALIEKQIMQFNHKQKQLWEDISNNISQQTTVEKSSQNLHKQAKKILSEMESKANELQEVENEIAKVKMDVLSTQQWNEVLKKKKDELNAEVEEKEELINDYEKKIRSNDEQINKKQLKVDKLNKKYAESTKDVKDDSTGPMEAEIKNMEKTNHELDVEIDMLSKQWGKNQTDLVKLSKSMHTLSEECNQLKVKKTVMDQKKIRLNAEVVEQNKEIRELKNALKNLRNDMKKLNELTAKNIAQHEKLGYEYFNSEQEFMARLKELETETSSLEEGIEQLKQGKADILTDIVEAERQILLWERKIQLEKEMQQTIDPNIGQKEVKDMKKEIHRMELRYDQLRRKQEQLIQEMEREIFKIESIQLKYQPKIAAKGNQVKQMNDLKQTLRHTSNNIQHLESTIQQQEAELSSMADEISDTSSTYQQMEEQSNGMRMELLLNRLERHRIADQTMVQQTTAKNYELLSQNKTPPPIQPVDINPLVNAVQETTDVHPQYTPVLQKLLQF